MGVLAVDINIIDAIVEEYSISQNVDKFATQVYFDQRTEVGAFGFEEMFPAPSPSALAIVQLVVCLAECGAESTTGWIRLSESRTYLFHFAVPL